MTPDTPITEDWLRTTGFRWEQLERQPSKHWILWIGAAISKGGSFWGGSDDFGIELCASLSGENYMLFVRADYCGRYTRFLFVRYVRTVGEVVRFVEAVTGIPFDARDIDGGHLRTPEEAARIRAQFERPDVQLALHYGGRIGQEEKRDPAERGAI